MTKNFYDGRPLEQGGTSIKGKGAAPYVRRLARRLEPGTRILDYGAGKYARNADYLTVQAKVTAGKPFSEEDTPALQELGEITLELERMRLEEPGATEDPNRVDNTSLLEWFDALFGE